MGEQRRHLSVQPQVHGQLTFSTNNFTAHYTIRTSEQHDTAGSYDLRPSSSWVVHSGTGGTGHGAAAGGPEYGPPDCARAIAPAGLDEGIYCL